MLSLASFSNVDFLRMENYFYKSGGESSSVDGLRQLIYEQQRRMQSQQESLGHHQHGREESHHNQQSNASGETEGADAGKVDTSDILPMMKTVNRG